MAGKDSISIWFFIGSLLLIYGVAIFVTNVMEMLSPSGGSTVVLQSLHFGVWWGLLLIIIGGTYFLHFRPWGRKG
jgi:integral membrane sensor domain MASE1